MHFLKRVYKKISVNCFKFFSVWPLMSWGTGIWWDDPDSLIAWSKRTHRSDFRFFLAISQFSRSVFPDKGAKKKNYPVDQIAKAAPRLCLIYWTRRSSNQLLLIISPFSFSHNLPSWMISLFLRRRILEVSIRWIFILNCLVFNSFRFL